MAASQNQLSSTELQELIKLLQVVEGLQEAAAQQEANRIASTATARRQLDALREEYQELTTDISDSLSVFKQLVSELGNASSGVTITTRAYKGIISIAEKLQLHQKDIVNLNEKDLKKLQEKLAIQKQNIVNSEEILKADEQRLSNETRLKTYDKDRLKNQINALEQAKQRRKLTSQEQEDLKAYRKEHNKLEYQLKNINNQLIKTQGYLQEIPGIIDGTDQNFKAVEATIKRIQEEIKEQNSLLGLGGSIIAGLGTALDKLGFGKLSQVLGISQATSEMEEFSSKIVKQRSEEANLRYKIEQTQQELNSKGYDQIFQNLEKEKQLEEEIAAARGHLTDAQLKAGFGGRALKQKQLELETTKSVITQEDRALHQKAQINNQNKVTLSQLAAQNAKYAGMNGHLAVLGKGIKSMGSSLVQNLTNPITQATFIVTQLMDAFKAIDNGAGKLAKGMNISYGEALKVREQFAEIARSSDSTFVTTEKLSESYLAISQALGANVRISEKDLDTFTKLREQAGYTNEELIGINKISMATGKSVDDTVTGFMGAGKALAIQKGLSINIKQLMKETANVSNAIKLSLGATPEALAKAAVKVKELGINLDQADKIASSLLQFESSITAELEAELLTGKEINLENARYYALMGDIGSMAEEINKEIGGSAEFTKMNRIQQEAYAKAVGMSREELANSLVEQEALSKLGRSLTEEEKAAYEFAKQRYGEEKAAQMLGENQLDVMMDQASTQERFTAAVEKLKDVFVSIVDGPLGSMLSGFATLLSNTALLKGLLVALGIAAIPLAVTLASAAIAAISTASGLTLGLGAIAIAAGIATAVAEMNKATSQAKSQYVIKDGEVDRRKGVTLSGDFGDVQLDGNDQVYDASKGRPIKVGTNLLNTTSASFKSSPTKGDTSTSLNQLNNTSQSQLDVAKQSVEEIKNSQTQDQQIYKEQNKSSSTQVSLLAKIAKILETQLMMTVAKDAANIIPFIGGMIGGAISAGIGGKALYDLNKSSGGTKPTTTTPKLADGGLVTKGGMAQVDSGEVYLGKSSLETLKHISVSLDKMSDTTNLNAVNALNKTDLVSSLSNTINKTQLIKDITNLEEEKIKNNETNLNTTNLFQPTPLNNTPETKLVTAPVSNFATTNNNSGGSNVINNNVIDSTKKFDQFIEEQRRANAILAQILSKETPKLTIDSREFDTIRNLSSART
jgi:hypothetical protein